MIKVNCRGNILWISLDVSKYPCNSETGKDLCSPDHVWADSDEIITLLKEGLKEEVGQATAVLGRAELGRRMLGSSESLGSWEPGFEVSSLGLGNQETIISLIIYPNMPEYYMDSIVYRRKLSI